MTYPTLYNLVYMTYPDIHDLPDACHFLYAPAPYSAYAIAQGGRIRALGHVIFRLLHMTMCSHALPE